MNAAEQIQLLFVLGPIAGLLALGFVITLRSGAASLSTGPGARLLFENLSRTLLLVTACLLGLVLVQQFLDIPTPLLR